MDFIVEVSARHVHLTQEHVEALFGKGHELTFDRPLSQPGQFLSKEKVTIKNGDRKIERVSILGPVRKASQVEVSKTDSVALRAEGFIRESGDLAGTAPVEIEGPEGSIQLSEGLIIAKRHIHMTPENAAEAGLKDKDVVSVAVNTDGRKTIFGDVVVRVSPSFTLAMHIDTDEANGANVPRLIITQDIYIWMPWSGIRPVFVWIP